MATDVAARQFRSTAELVEFMEQNNLASGDVVQIMDGDDGPSLVYNAGAIDTEGPDVRVSRPTSAQQGDSVHFYFQVGESAALKAITGTAATSGLVLYYRTGGAPTWNEGYPRKIAVRLYDFYLPGSVVQPPRVEWYLVAQDGLGNTTNVGTASSPNTITV